MKKKPNANKFLEEIQWKADKAIVNPNSEDGQFFKMIIALVEGKSKKGVIAKINPAFHFTFLDIPKELIIKTVQSRKYGVLEHEILAAFRYAIENVCNEHGDLIVEYYQNDLSKFIEDLKQYNVKD